MAIELELFEACKQTVTRRGSPSIKVNTQQPVIEHIAYTSCLHPETKLVSALKRKNIIARIIQFQSNQIPSKGIYSAWIIDIHSLSRSTVKQILEMLTVDKPCRVLMVGAMITADSTIASRNGIICCDTLDAAASQLQN